MNEGEYSEVKDLFEIQFFESLYKKLPNDKKVLSILAELYTSSGEIDKGLKLDEKLVKMDPTDACAYYNLACSYSLKNRLNEAMEALRQAVSLGYRDFKWMLEDADLESLRCSVSFKGFLDDLGIV